MKETDAGPAHPGTRPDAECLTTKRRVCFLTRTPVSDTPYAEVALPALARAGWKLTVVAPDADGSILRRFRPFPCRNVRLCANGRFQGIRAELSLLRALLAARFGPYDVIYVNSQSLSARAVFALAGPKLGKRLVYHNPDFYDPSCHSLYYRLERHLCRKADLYINNEFHRGYITQTFYRMRCPVLTAPPNLPAAWPIPDQCARRRHEINGGQEDAFVLMLHGSYAEIRMVPELLQALRLLPTRFRLAMMGADHRKAEVDGVLRSLNLLERVARLPRLGFCEMLAYTVNADAGVLLYQNNDLGNFFTAPGRMTEYMACGLPVLGTDHTGLENLILKYGLGQAVDSTDPRAIARGIERLADRQANEPALRNTMRQRFLDHFAFDHWEPLVVEAFERLVRHGKQRTTERPPYPWMPNP